MTIILLLWLPLYDWVYYRRYLPKYHPVLAVHYLRQGKLHRVTGTTEHLKQSIEDLTRVYIHSCGGI